MKSILQGGNRIFEVYTAESLIALEQSAGLQPVCHTKEDVLQNPSAYYDTEFIFSTWGMPSFTKQEIAVCFPALRAVFYAAGSVQSFARPFLESGVLVFSAWGANAIPVVEFTVAQIILANKGYFQSSRLCIAPEQYSRKHLPPIVGNFGAKVGIIGAGMIGSGVIQYLKPYRLEVLVHDPFLSKEKAAFLGAKKASLTEIFTQCLTISNHTANLPETEGMLHYGYFSQMQKNATFINTGRGAQVVEEDLIRALTEEPGRTALLDVTDPEPPAANSKLYTMQNVFLTPHIAGSLGDEVARMGDFMVAEYENFRTGKPYAYNVTLEMLKTMA